MRGGRREGAGRPRREGEVPPVRACTECGVLREEVARLKRELAGRVATPTMEVRRERFGLGDECIHGGSYGVCRKLGCRAK